jgi:hypothetical protein
MAAPILIRRELKNARLYFIPSAEVVDTVTVTATTWPDNSPSSNWTAYQFQDIETVKSVRTIKTESFNVPDDGGGYTEDIEEMVTSRKWTATTHKTNNYIKQLENGIFSPLVASAAQAPGAKTDNFLDGVMLLEVQNKSGTIIERVQVWARLRVTSEAEIGPASSSVELSFELRTSALNTFVAYA